MALVLGAHVYADGTPSPFLARRLGAMTRYVVGRGVPVGKVVADHAGFDTYDSCVRA